MTRNDAQIVAEYEADLMSGAVFSRMAASHRSRYGYEPPVTRRDVSTVYAVLAEMLRESDALAQVAIGVRVNLYGTDSQAGAAIWDAIAKAVREGYDDVIGRAAPDASGPRRLYQRPFKLGELLRILAYGVRMVAPFDSSVPSIGWCASALAEREGLQLSI